MTCCQSSGSKFWMTCLRNPWWPVVEVPGDLF